MTKRSYTRSELEEAITESSSYHEALLKLGLNARGQAYVSIKNAINEWDISTEHFKRPSPSKGFKKIPLSEILVKNSSYPKSSSLLYRLIYEGIFNWQCEKCKRVDWLGEQIPLHLDHKNGIRNDNRIENLRPLCPNCHSQTETFAARNIGNSKNSPAAQAHDGKNTPESD